MSFQGYLFLLSVVFFTVTLASEVPTQPENYALLVTRIPEKGMALYITPYKDGILHLIIRPEKEWTFTVPHSVIATPVPFGKRGLNCTPQGETCVVNHDNCTMSIRLAENASKVAVNYTCGGLLLVAAMVELQQTPRAVVTSTFPTAKTLYGLAGHAADLPLRSGHSYGLYHHDNSPYPLNTTNARYGAVPFIMAASTRATTGVLFRTAAELNVSVTADEQGSTVHSREGNSGPPACEWRAEVGPVDLFFLPGPTPAAVQHQHASLTGPTVFPPVFALGYHTSLQRYPRLTDALAVDEGFDQHHIPYDALWLDSPLSHLGKGSSWEEDPLREGLEGLSGALASKGRRLGRLTAPLIPREAYYSPHEAAEGGGGHSLRLVNGSPSKAACGAGECSWPDFLRTRTREWYAGSFHPREASESAREGMHTWLILNEPSVWNGPRGMMEKEVLHEDDDGHAVEHRHVHNLYGLLSVMAAYKGAVEAAKESAVVKRPFLLTHSFFVGSQRYAAMWAGDNMARWDHLQSTSAMLLSLSISNYPFCGADVGGFFFHPEEELFVRWMQSGIFYPFFRSHAHHDTPRREPWNFSEEAQHHIRNALALRYALIPYLYTTFYDAHCRGGTVLRPLFFEFPEQEDLWGEQATFMFGPSLLVSPVVHRNATETTVRLPTGEVWYEYSTGEAITGRKAHQMSVVMSTIPLFVRGGHIVPLKLRLRRNTNAARGDPLTLYVALNAAGESRGELYLDDGTTFHYQQGQSLYRRFEFSNYHLRCTNHPEASKNSTFTVPNVIERIVLMGYNRKLLRIYHVPATGERLSQQTEGEPLRFERVGNSVIVHNPRLSVGEDWEICFENE